MGFTMKLLSTLCLMLMCLTLSTAWAGDYRLLEGDSLTISVYGEEDLKGEARVTPNGRISFPLAGTLKAKGRTVAELERAIASRLTRYIPEAQVSVVLVTSEGNKIYVLGKVNKPGAIVMQSPMTVAQALAMVGGLNKFADEDKIRVLRRDKHGEQIQIPVNYEDLMSGKDLSSNRWLFAGDTILVP
jgi:polysaccharide export outer membrane protein